MDVRVVGEDPLSIVVAPEAREAQLHLLALVVRSLVCCGEPGLVVRNIIINQ